MNTELDRAYTERDALASENIELRAEIERLKTLRDVGPTIYAKVPLQSNTYTRSDEFTD